MKFLEALRISDAPKRKAAIEKATKEHHAHLDQLAKSDKGKYYSFTFFTI